MRSRYLTQIADVCRPLQLDPLLLEAQLLVESGDDPFAWNPEPRYQYFWDVKRGKPFRRITAAERASEDPPADFPTLAGDPDQEWWGQQASWGLLQIMGAVAREHSFLGAYLTRLTDPILNLTLGAAHFARLLRWAEGNREQALAAYNGGMAGNARAPLRNQGYVEKVLHRLAAVQQEADRG